MNFYSPMSSAPSGGAVQSYSAPGSTPAATATPGSSNLGAQKVGYLDTQQVGTGQWGTGQSFQGAGRQGILEAMQGAMSKANPADYANMDSLRSYYASQLADLPGQTGKNVSSFDTSSQRGLSNLLGQYRNSQAGTGNMGSRQYAGAQGDIYSKAATDYNTGLINARNQALNQAGTIQKGMSGVQNQDLQERQFQVSQAQSLSDQIYKLMGLDQGYQSMQEGIRQYNQQMEWAKIQKLTNPGGLMAGSSGVGASGGGGSGGGSSAGTAAGTSAGEGAASDAALA